MPTTTEEGSVSPSRKKAKVKTNMPSKKKTTNETASAKTASTSLKQTYASKLKRLETELEPLKPLRRSVAQLEDQVVPLKRKVEMEDEPKLPEDTFSFLLTSSIPCLSETVFPHSNRPIKEDPTLDVAQGNSETDESSYGNNEEADEEHEQKGCSKYFPFLWAMTILGVQLFIYSVVLQAFVQFNEIPMGVTNMMVAAQVIAMCICLFTQGDFFDGVDLLVLGNNGNFYSSIDGQDIHIRSPVKFHVSVFLRICKSQAISPSMISESSLT